MSRVIKFRAWDGNKNRFTVENDLMAVSFDGTVEHCSDMGIYHRYDLKLMQFTGLKDKNGVEIYEGDIVRLDTPDGDPRPEIVATVEYMPEAMMFVASVSKDEFVKFGGQGGKNSQQWRSWLIENDYVCHMVVVIGNIYENPDLLEARS